MKAFKEQIVRLLGFKKDGKARFIITKFQRLKTRRFLKQGEKKEQVACKGFKSVHLSFEVKCGFFYCLLVVCI